MALNTKKSPLFGPYFPHLSHVTCFIGFISFDHTQWDVELNSGLKRKATQTLSICHWNLNSICAHNFAELSLSRAM